jgi:hypothetical protein
MPAADGVVPQTEGVVAHANKPPFFGTSFDSESRHELASVAPTNAPKNLRLKRLGHIVQPKLRRPASPRHSMRRHLGKSASTCPRPAVFWPVVRPVP